MSKLYPSVDPQGLLEYSVVFNDRSLNHMSQSFQSMMREISGTLNRVYRSAECLLVPGGGTVGMEAIARQFATGKRCLVLRNGWFSYRWTQIFESGAIPAEHKALLARPDADRAEASYSPLPLPELLEEIRRFKPDLFFAAHVETASGMLLPDDYLRAAAEEVHRQGGLFVLDCIASGTLWIDMPAIGVDILLSAPQKSWSAPPSSALIALSAAGAAALQQSKPHSFALDLQKWRQIMKAYEDGGHAYHATLPTDALARLHESMRTMEELGWETLRQKQIALGSAVRELLRDKGYPSVASEAFAAPTVIVSYTREEALQKGTAFARLGLQTAAGVPLACEERADFRSFRIGLFGLDKLLHPERTLETLAMALKEIP